MALDLTVESFLFVSSSLWGFFRLPVLAVFSRLSAQELLDCEGYSVNI